MGDYSFFWVFKDPSAARKRAKKAERAFDQPAVSEVLARSGLGSCLPEDPKGRSKFVRKLFAAVCGRSGLKGLTLNQPADGAMYSSLYDEECSGQELEERRRRQAAAALTLFQRGEFHACGPQPTGLQPPERSPVTLSHCEQLIAAWQPTARSPSIDATMEPDWTSALLFVSEVLDARRNGRPISITAVQEQRLLASVDTSTEVMAKLLRCDVGVLATLLINDRSDQPSAALGVRLLDHLSSRGDPYACIQMARVLQSGELVRRDPKRALSLAEKGLLGKHELLQASSVGEAHRVIGLICAFDPSSRNLKRALAAFKAGAALGDYWCALEMARLLGGTEHEELRRRHDIQRRTDEALHYLAQAVSYVYRAYGDPDDAVPRKVKDELRRVLDEIQDTDSSRSISEPQP